MLINRADLLKAKGHELLPQWVVDASLVETTAEKKARRSNPKLNGAAKFTLKQQLLANGALYTPHNSQGRHYGSWVGR